MAEINDGGPAFPRPESEYVNPYGKKTNYSAQNGMSLRDYFAAKALQGIAADPIYNPATFEEAAEAAYMAADAMLKAREVQNG